MKILAVHSSATLYGSDRCLMSIVNGLVMKNNEIHVVLPNPGILADELKKRGARVIFLEALIFRRDILSWSGALKMMMRSPVSVRQLVKLMQREKYDVIYTNTGVTLGGAIAAKMCRIPHVWHFREILKEFSMFLRLYEPVVLILSTRLIFITKAVRDQFTSGRIKEKDRVIYDGIPTENFTKAAPEKLNRRVVVTSVGMLAPYKGQDVLLRAIAGVVEAGVDVEVYIVGDVYAGRDDFMDKLSSLAKEHRICDKINLVGFQEDVLPFLEACNIFIMPSTRQEPLGIVILEAMAANRAVIATNGGGAREIIKNNENGLLVPAGNSVAMTKAIIFLAEHIDDRQRLAARGRAIVMDKYTEEAMVSSVIKQFEEVFEIARHGHRSSEKIR